MLIIALQVRAFGSKFCHDSWVLGCLHKFASLQKQLCIPGSNCQLPGLRSEHLIPMQQPALLHHSEQGLLGPADLAVGSAPCRNYQAGPFFAFCDGGVACFVPPSSSTSNSTANTTEPTHAKVQPQSPDMTKKTRGIFCYFRMELILSQRDGCSLKKVRVERRLDEAKITTFRLVAFHHVKMTMPVLVLVDDARLPIVIVNRKPKTATNNLNRNTNTSLT